MRLRILATCVGLLAISASATGQTVPQKSGLTRLLEAELSRFSGPGGPYQAGIYVEHIASGEKAIVHGDDHFNSASVIKLGVLALAFKQVDEHKLNLTERYEITPSDWRTGSGIFRYHDAGLKPTLRDVATEMVITSDNGATDIMIAKVGGVDAVNAYLKSAGYKVLHLNHTLNEGSRARYERLDPKYKALTPEQVFALQSNEPALLEKHKALIAEIAAAEKVHPNAGAPAPLPESQYLGIITPTEIGTMLAGIERCTIVSKESCEEIKRMLRAQQSGQRKIPHFLDVPVAHKTGEVGGVTNDVGIIYAKSGPIVVSFLSQGYTGSIGEADDRLGAVARLIVEYFDGAS